MARSYSSVRTDLIILVFDDELFAIAGDDGLKDTTIEKRNKYTKKWEFVTDLGEDRVDCASCLVGSKIFLFGVGKHKSTFDYFDLVSKRWASKTEGRYKSDEARRLPREIK